VRRVFIDRPISAAVTPCLASCSSPCQIRINNTRNGDRAGHRDRSRLLKKPRARSFEETLRVNMRQVRAGTRPKVWTGSEGNRAHLAWHQIRNAHGLRDSWACPAKRIPAQPLPVPRIISCRHRHCSERKESWRSGTNHDCRTIWILGDSANLLRDVFWRPTVPDPHFSPLCPRRVSACGLRSAITPMGGLRWWSGAGFLPTTGLPLQSGVRCFLAFGDHRWHPLFIAQPVPGSPPCGRQAGHEAPTACATSPAGQCLFRLPFSSSPWTGDGLPLPVSLKAYDLLCRPICCRLCGLLRCRLRP